MCCDFGGVASQRVAKCKISRFVLFLSHLNSHPVFCLLCVVANVLPCLQFRQIALLILGEIGRENDLAEHKNIECMSLSVPCVHSFVV